MSLIEKLKADHLAARRKIVVLDTEIWCSPLTLAEQARVTAKYPNDATKRQTEILVLKCTDADGKPIFTKEDKLALAAEVSGDRFADVWAAINGRTVAEQAEK